MKRLVPTFLLALLLSVSGASALELQLPESARKTIQNDTKLDSYAAPTSPFQDGEIATSTIEGRVSRSAWRVASPGITPLQILAPLREQLAEDGYDTVLDCDQNTCGGFDFRFGTEVLSAPDMFVNIRSFRFLTALKGGPDAPTGGVSLLVSTSETGAFLQIIQAGKEDANSLQIDTKAPTPTAQTVTPVIVTSLDADLLGKGSAVLNGLDFATGTSDLGTGPFPVLKELASFFAARNDIRLVLVGHTDSVGALDFNIRLSKQRATSVRKRLLEAYGLDGNRVAAEGNGYLSPIMSNLNGAGRTANRRVEAVVLPLN